MIVLKKGRFQTGGSSYCKTMTTKTWEKVETCVRSLRKSEGSEGWLTAQTRYSSWLTDSVSSLPPLSLSRDDKISSTNISLLASTRLSPSYTTEKYPIGHKCVALDSTAAHFHSDLLYRNAKYLHAIGPNHVMWRSQICHSHHAVKKITPIVPSKVYGVTSLTSIVPGEH